MFKQLTDKVNYAQLEQEVLKFWNDNKVFEQSVSTREGKPGFTFYEGPPTANGRPGIHHVMSRTLKDLVCRYKTMRGYQVHRKAGWDTHGLPVEIEVEKMLGFKDKSDILTYGIEKFNEECKKSVWKYKVEWERMTRMMGYWVNLDDPYVTFENNYIESVWWSLKQYFDKGMIFKGHKIQPYCFRCGTPLSSHEVALGYKEVAENSVYMKFKLTGQENTFILSWTTTPWTLPGNIALAIGEKIEYSKIKVGEEYWILATALLAVIKDPYEVVQTMTGAELVGLEYVPLFNIEALQSDKSYRVYAADFVTTTDGTGVVHTAVMYGEDDYQLGKKIGLPTHHTVDEAGKFTKDVVELVGMLVKDKATEKAIFNHLKANNTMVRIEQYTHDYPFCWRCSSPLLYYARESWYIRTTAYAQRMSELNKEINWIPSEVGSGRFGNWLDENKDWALSRDRFWGTPLPIWICNTCGKLECIGSVEQLKVSAGKAFTDAVEHNNSVLDLHKPFVDKLTWACSCGGTMKRTPELIDVWYDSGSMPFAQWHYPFENKEIFEANYPGDYISEGIDQTRGWFYTLHSIGTFLFDKPAYKNCLVNELILDKSGQKMSKTKGNTVNPFDIMEKYGADATRWYLITNSPPWKPTLFDEEGLADVHRKFFGTLVNTYAFFALYANIDNFNYNEKSIPLSERPEIDRWIISELNSLIKRYIVWMDAYDVTKAAKAVSDFTIDLVSNWYVRRNRRRFWSKELPTDVTAAAKDKTAAYQTLYECLNTIAKLMAPFAPFLAEELYGNLNNATKREPFTSVHLVELPAADESAIDLDLETKMDKAQRIVSLVREIRNRSNLKVRQPLKKILIPVKSKSEADMLKTVEGIILEETNIKELDPQVDANIIKYKIKANFKVLGQKYGKITSKIAAVIQAFTPQQISSLDAEGKIDIVCENESYTIVLDDVQIIAEDIKGWLVKSDGTITVALDTELTPALIEEGFAREFVNRVQNMRKDAGFEVMDRIKIFYNGTEPLNNALRTFETYVMNETLAIELHNNAQSGEYSADEDINGEQCHISVLRVQE